MNDHSQEQQPITESTDSHFYVKLMTDLRDMKRTGKGEWSLPTKPIRNLGELSVKLLNGENEEVKGLSGDRDAYVLNNTGSENLPEKISLKEAFDRGYFLVLPEVKTNSFSDKYMFLNTKVSDDESAQEFRVHLFKDVEPKNPDKNGNVYISWPGYESTKVEGRSLDLVIPNRPDLLLGLSMAVFQHVPEQHTEVT